MHGGRVLQVNIPQNAAPNSVLQVVDPLTNQAVQFVVPPGSYPGQVINFNVDSGESAPPAAVAHQQASHQAVKGAPTKKSVKHNKKAYKQSKPKSHSDYASSSSSSFTSSSYSDSDWTTFKSIYSFTS